MGVPKIKWWLLKNPETSELFRRKVMEETRPIEGVNEWWNENSRVIKQVAVNILGKTSGKSPPNDKESWWWNGEVQKAIKEKKDAKKMYDRSQTQEDKDRYNQAKKEAKRMVARAKAKKICEATDTQDTVDGKRKLLRIAKEKDRASKDFTHIKQIKSERGMVIRKEEDIKYRWREYFEKLLNEENHRSIFEDGIPNHGITEEISRDEVAQALKKMKNGKSTGPDEISVEAWKCLGEYGIDMLCDLMNQVLNEERMPNEWRDSVIVPIYKEKGDIQDCKNYRGIKLISHTMKIWERIIDTRIRKETSIGEEQFGFMPGRGTMDAVYALRQLMEKYRDKKKDLHLIFIDLEKAYDRIPRQEVWRCLRKKNVPEKYVRIIKDMYEGARTRVRSCVGMSDSINVNVGLHQGSVLSPYLFDLVIDCITEDTREEAPWSMMFADDIVLCDPDRESIENKVNMWKTKMEERGLKINTTKTVHLHLNEKERSQESDEEDADDIMDELRIKLGDTYLENVKKFKYLGSSVCTDGELDEEIASRINAGWMNWRKMSGVLCDKRISPKNKGYMYKTIVRPAMLYGAETWPIKKRQEERMNVAEMRMLRWMCGVTRMDRIRNTRIRGTVKVTEISRKIQERRLQWFGHVERRDQEYVGKRLRDMEVGGKRDRGRPRMRYMDKVKQDLKEKKLEVSHAQNRGAWKRLIQNVDPT
ncbi:hypothetical protein M8J77_020866 [Diaphorina citri]|nr:hypothetical protein M8J77_020866 [Diaphorina citri]